MKLSLAFRFLSTNKDYPSLITQQVKSNPIVMYSRTNCQQCNKAKLLFSEYKLTPYTIEIDQQEDATSLREAVESLTKQKRTPMIFIKGESIGGLGGLKNMLKNKQIQADLQNLK
ncbi:unnamed protein product [Blepharisma stoltei]|uniref:Glutaredoxin domain-containing protein n=1 Tax=Blepharisma stoltei TaxID=1481888 RepID=A0AAU9KE80_9CILI|nr:unnamed protein product [Blepharisma stoltei]